MYNLKKLLPIKLVLSQSHRQNGTKFPHAKAWCAKASYKLPAQSVRAV